MTKHINIFLAFATLALAGCAPVSEMKARDKAEMERNVQGFKAHVSALYPGCEYIRLKVIGPGFYDDSGHSYRATAVIQLSDGTRKQIQMVCKQGACWEVEHGWRGSGE